jgi:hypothetical protein
MGFNDAEDERRFATAARVSEINLALYRAFAQPWVRGLVAPPTAEWLHKMHPLRLQYEVFSDANPAMGSVARLAERVHADRRLVSGGNPFLALQEKISEQMVTGLDAWRRATETLAEQTFLAVYGSRALQAAVGMDPADVRTVRRATKSKLYDELLTRRTKDRRSRIAVGGAREAIVRATLYAGMARRAIDERGFELARRIRRAHGDMPLAEFKTLVREQFHILLIDEEAALAAIPAMLPPEADARAKAFGLIEQLLSARGALSIVDRERLDVVGRLFAGTEKGAALASSSRQSLKQHEAGAPLARPEKVAG